jgi:hypothetical protein
VLRKGLKADFCKRCKGKKVMKNAIWFLLLGLWLNSCGKEDFQDGLMSCGLEGQVKSVRDAKGVVSFNSVEQVYVVAVHHEGTIDSEDIGFVCNLPEEYQHDGFRVRFSGSYYEYDEKYGRPAVGGQTYYYLELLNIVPGADD